MNEEKYLQLELLIGENQKYNTTTLGFNIAPKINSFGRLPELVNPNHLVHYFLKEPCSEEAATTCPPGHMQNENTLRPLGRWATSL